MSVTQAAALSFMMGQHMAEEQARDAQREPETSTEVTMVPRPSKPRKVSTSYIAAVASHSIHQPEVKATIPSSHPEKGSLEARGFILAMRRAKTRSESIFAIAAFIGYDNSKDFGSQELAAMSAAKRELSGPTHCVSPAEKRATFRSLTGFVAGLPDTTQRKVADLLARETASAEALISHEKDAADSSRTTADRTLSKGLAEVERERLGEIRKDLQGLGG